MGALLSKDGVGGPRGEFLFYFFLDALLVMRTVLWPFGANSVFPYVRVMLPLA